MVSRTTVMTVPLAALLVLSGCSGTGDSGTDDTASAEQTSSAAAAPAESETPTEGESAEGESAQDAGTSTDVKDLPDFIKPYPDSTVVSASVSKATTDKDKKTPEQVSLVMKAKAGSKDVFKFYEKELGKADFESFGDESKTKSGKVLNFKHKKNDGLLVVTVAKDPDDKANSIVTIGGNVE